MTRLPRACVALLFLLAAAAGFAQPGDVYPAHDATVSLNGTWDFKYVAGTDAQFGDNPAGFAPIAVPGHWELQGFAEPKYGSKLAAGTGLYRRTFRVPADWAGQRIMLRFDGVLYGFEAWVNGVSVGSWASGYNPATFDITDQLKPGADNTLTVRVTTRSHGWEFDTNDCWSISGIYRDVTLFAVPAAHLEKYTARTHLNADGSATLTVGVQLSETTTVTGRLRAPWGKPVQELKFIPGESGAATATVSIEHPQLWTTETPLLYTLDLALSSGEHVTEKIGLREVTIKDGILQLNGRPIKLHGVDHHDLWPEHGRTATMELMRRDLALMRAANINFIRTSHYPPDPRFLALCDELGFYVMDEVPFGFGDEHLADPDYQPDLYTRAQATVTRDANHPCVIVWSVGNENPNTPLTIATARRVKELDPTRPVCFPQVGSYFAKHYPELPPDIDIFAPHYPGTAMVQEYATKFDRPVIFTEYAHQLGLASDQVQAQWAIIQANPKLAGGSIWMFQDQGILRSAAPGQTPDTTHDLNLAVWPDANHYYDGSGNQGMDGIVYADRTPQVDYWEVRKVYSPVQLAAPGLTIEPGPNVFTVQVENRFDFRSLNGLTLAWSLVHDGRALASSSTALSAAAHATQAVKLSVGAVKDVADGFNWLELRVLDEHGVSFHERSFRIATGATMNPAQQFLTTLSPNELKLQETADAFSVKHPHFTLTLAKATGALTLHDATGRELAAGFGPHTGRRFTEGEFIRSKKESTWTGALLATARATVSATRIADGIVLRVNGQYARPDAPEQSLEGGFDLLVHPDGSMAVHYDYAPVNAKGLFLEAGVSLLAPAGESEFHWVGAGPYPGYPGKDALNEFGIYHLNRRDLNFSGNRRGVEFAALTTPQGAGVLLIPEHPADVAVERTDAGTVFSHNALLSGRGTKFVGPDTAIKSEAAGHLSGRFTLVPLKDQWPEPLARWFGVPSAAQPFQPYYHSYDQ